MSNIKSVLEDFCRGEIMECETVLKYKQSFFKRELNLEFRDNIISHLLRCKDCHDAYEEYAKSIGLVFDVVREAMKIYTEYDSETIPQSSLIIINNQNASTQKIKEKVKKDSNKSNRNVMDRWTTAYKLNDYSELMNVKAVRDVLNSAKNDTLDEEQAECNREFTMYITKKICQKIDHLEKCLKLKESEGKKDA